MDAHKEIKDFIPFLNDCPTPWHTVDTLCERLEAAKFVRLREGDKWKLKKGGKYYVTRNGSSLCAFIVPRGTPESARVIASHTDSPGFKLKPHAEYKEKNMIMFGIEPYGSPLLASWLNRDLGIAGRVLYTNKKGNISKNLVCVDEYPLTIPQLALHLSPKVNDEGVVLDKEKNLVALAALDTEFKEKEPYLEALLEIDIDFEKILSHDLYLFPIEKPRLIGNREMISGYRLDNIASVHASLHAIIKAKPSTKHRIHIAAFSDNEEIGSRTAQGAASPFLGEVFERIALNLGLEKEDIMCMKSRSLCASVDAAHAFHPAHSDAYEPHHHALMDHGAVLKTDAQQRYATDAVSSALTQHLCDKHKIKLQRYITRNDIRGGSTIGPIHATSLGIKTVDIGEPILSMHSCRELMSCHDHIALCKLLEKFLIDGCEA
ncbi:MAG: M18 family aminopeptidase [Waddliaceae bacterium]|nr:M18 family aminopeptidase [Waddliaceae bacterium]